MGPCLRPAVGRPPPRLPPIACSCGGALGGRLCPLRRQPRLLRAEPARAAQLASTLRGRRGEAPNFFHPPTPLRSCTGGGACHRGCAGRSAAKIPLTCRRTVVWSWQDTVMAPTWPPLIATCSQGSERGANHQGMAHPDTPRTPHKRAPFGGVPRGGQKRGPKKVSKKVSRMGELLNTPFFVHNFVPRGPIFGPPRGDPPFWGPSSRDSRGFGPKKGGFWGSENPPRRPPGAPGPAPGISPPGPARAPGRPPRDPPSGTPLGSPLWDPPRR